MQIFVIIRKLTVTATVLLCEIWVDPQRSLERRQDWTHFRNKSGKITVFWEDLPLGKSTLPTFPQSNRSTQTSASIYTN